jgi:hypothetical protein
MPLPAKAGLGDVGACQDCGRCPVKTSPPASSPRCCRPLHADNAGRPPNLRKHARATRGYTRCGCWQSAGSGCRPADHLNAIDESATPAPPSTYLFSYINAAQHADASRPHCRAWHSGLAGAALLASTGRRGGGVRPGSEEVLARSCPAPLRRRLPAAGGPWPDRRWNDDRVSRPRQVDFTAMPTPA